MKTFDVIIIGAGILGLSTAFKLTEKNPSLKICIIEKENSCAFHQTGHNSGVIHSGIYYKPGSLKAQNCRKGYNMLLEFCNKYNVKYEICGKIIIATKEKELEPLNELYNRGIENGLEGMRIINENEIKAYEPFAAGLKALHVPQTGITDFKIVSLKISGLILSKGVKIFYNETAEKIERTGNETKLTSDKKLYSAKVIVSCAGLYSDKIAELSDSNINFRIIPFRGEYYKLKDSSRQFVRNLIYPVPDPEFPFLGVHFTRRISGIVEAGPNAVLAFKKEGYGKFDFNLKDVIDTLSFKGFQKVIFKYWKTGFYEMYRSLSKNEFVKSLQKLIPGISSDDIEPCGSGVRAQACDINGNLIDDFLIMENKYIINVCNAPSPAATSCFSIGDTISDKVLNKF